MRKLKKIKANKGFKSFHTTGKAYYHQVIQNKYFCLYTTLWMPQNFDQLNKSSHCFSEKISNLAPTRLLLIYNLISKFILSQSSEIPNPFTQKTFIFKEIQFLNFFDLLLLLLDYGSKYTPMKLFSVYLGLSNIYKSGQFGANALRCYVRYDTFFVW